MNKNKLLRHGTKIDSKIQKKQEMKKFIIICIAVLLTSTTGISQNFWEKTNAPDTATTFSIAVNSNGDIFAATGDGLFRSLDDGDNWQNLGIDMGIRLIYIGPNGVIYLTTREQGSILCSSDNGSNWTSIGLTSWQNSIAINLNGHIFAGTDNFGIYRTTNNGGKWIRIINGLTDTHITSLVINSNQNILAGTIFNGVFRSSDNGENWIPVNQGLTTNYITALTVNSNGDIFAGTSGYGIFRSTNNGENWVQINQGITGENRWVQTILSSNEGIFAGTAGGVLLSQDNGENWVNVNAGLNNYTVRSLENNSTVEIFAGTSGGIFRHLSNTTSVAPDTRTTSSFELLQNYPNPFNPTTKIVYQLPYESKVVVKIYNILGSEVSELLNAQQGAGKYEIEFNAGSLSSGIYFYKIYAGNFIQTRKMILSK